MDYIIRNWPITGVILWIVLTDVLPKSLKFIAQYILPARTKEKIAMLEAATKEKEQQIAWEHEQKEAEHDLKERTVLVQEKATQMLILQNAALQSAHEDHLKIMDTLSQMMISLATVTATLNLLVEKTYSRRKEVETSSIDD